MFNSLLYLKQSLDEWFPKTLPIDFTYIPPGVYTNKEDIEIYEPLDCIVNEGDNLFKTQCVSKVRIPKNSLVIKPKNYRMIRSNDAIVESLEVVDKECKTSDDVMVIDAWIPEQIRLNDCNMDLLCRHEIGKKRIESMSIDHSPTTQYHDLQILTSKEDAIASFKEIQKIRLDLPYINKVIDKNDSCINIMENFTMKKGIVKNM